jgi:hypothetical protein
MSELLLDRAGRRRSPATLPGFHVGHAPGNKGLRYPADPPKVEEIIAVMRTAGDGAHGRRLRGLIVIMWCAGLRIQEALALNEGDLDHRRGSLLVRRGKGGRRREVGMDAWGWEQLQPWLGLRRELPVGPLLCVLNGATRPVPLASRRTGLAGIANAELRSISPERALPVDKSMAILSNALPGFRDLRAPLVAGYCWLLFAWLVVEPHLPVREATGLLDSLLDLSGAVGKVGTALAVSVAAYLIGSVSGSVSRAAARAITNAIPETPGRTAVLPKRILRWMVGTSTSSIDATSCDP